MSHLDFSANLLTYRYELFHFTWEAFIQPHQPRRQEQESTVDFKFRGRISSREDEIGQLHPGTLSTGPARKAYFPKPIAVILPAQQLFPHCL
jgi:hypothetical protein